MKNFKFQDWLGIAFIVVFISAAGYLWLSPSGMQPAPDLTMTILNGGQKIKLSQYRGRPVLVTFWSTSCPGCIREMPHLIELYHDLAPKGLEIIGVAMAHDRPDHVLEMQRQKGIPYPVVWDGQSEASLGFGRVRLTPTTFLINPEGQIVIQKIGEMDMKLVRAQILSMLNNKKG